jgi:hypothetical protein
LLCQTLPGGLWGEACFFSVTCIWPSEREYCQGDFEEKLVSFQWHLSGL